MFTFKQFSVEDDQSTMKIGTDAVILGAIPYFYSVPTIHRILDIGTGCGVVALMRAQKSPKAIVDAIDIDPSSVKQAQQNFSQSPWADRMHALQSPLQEYQARPYDMIVCNPPYFENSLKSPDSQRTLARHNDTLSFTDLVRHAQRLLTPEGTFECILPADAANHLLEIATQHGLRCEMRIAIHNRPGDEAIRTILTLTKSESHGFSVESHTLRNADNSYSDWYRNLTDDYLTHLR